MTQNFSKLSEIVKYSDKQYNMISEFNILIKHLFNMLYSFQDKYLFLEIKLIINNKLQFV